MGQIESKVKTKKKTFSIQGESRHEITKINLKLNFNLLKKKKIERMILKII